MVGQKYFCGLVRLNQFQVMFLILVWEVLNCLITLIQLAVFFFSKNKLIQHESYTVEFECTYLMVFNSVPILIMIRSLVLYNSINQFDKNVAGRLDESLHQSIINLDNSFEKVSLKSDEANLAATARLKQYRELVYLL